MQGGGHRLVVVPEEQQKALARAPAITHDAGEEPLPYQPPDAGKIGPAVLHSGRPDDRAGLELLPRTHAQREEIALAGDRGDLRLAKAHPETRGLRAAEHVQPPGTD